MKAPPAQLWLLSISSFFDAVFGKEMFYKAGDTDSQTRTLALMKVTLK